MKFRKKFGPLFWTAATFLIAAITLVFLIYYYFLDSILYHNNPEKTGAIGDTLGGTTGPIIGITAAALTFFAFWVQYIANQQQQEDLKVERFENKFYEMLRLHRDNVEQININNNVSGRKTFSRLFNELRFIYFYCFHYIKKLQPNYTISDDKIYNISYLIFFYGVGQVSTKLINDILDEETKPIFNKLVGCIESTQQLYRKGHKNLTLKVESNKGIDIRFYYDYIPFQGHLGNLGHYMRHLYQLVMFIEKVPMVKDHDKLKKDYITIVRSQLSDYEQALLYYNALSILGKPWLENDESQEGPLKKYSLIRSFPKPLADFYKKPDNISFGKDSNWDEIKTRFGKII